MTDSTSKFMRKGELTRVAILEMALELASRGGLEGLTIGLLADKMGMSKSGVFAHFGSREDLQIEVVKLYQHHFEQDVFYPAMKEPCGLPRLHAMFVRWVKRMSAEMAAGCLYIGGAVEYDDRPGALHEKLAEMACAWKNALRLCVMQAIEMKHVSADTDPDQLVFEMYGLILALHHDARFLKLPGSIGRAETGFERLIKNCQGAQPVEANYPAGKQNLKSTVTKSA